MKTEPRISPYEGHAPRIHDGAFIDLSALIIGDVVIEEGASVWPMSVIRADSSPIRIGSRAAILDLCLLEAPEGTPVVIEEESLISHGAIVHGARICRGALVGIRAVVLDGAVVGPGSIVGAASLVTAGASIPPNSLVMGTPAKIVRETTASERAGVSRQIEELYEKARRYRSGQ
jgi:carbonic anhydrase/acetyltransferase-like protein (isoleucine patch superfamily)